MGNLRWVAVCAGILLTAGCTNSAAAPDAPGLTGAGPSHQSSHAAVYTDPNGRALARTFDSVDQKMLWLRYSGAAVSASPLLTGGSWLSIADTDVPQPLALTGLMVQVDAKGAPSEQMTPESRYATDQTTDVQSALDDAVQQSAAAASAASTSTAPSNK